MLYEESLLNEAKTVSELRIALGPVPDAKKPSVDHVASPVITNLPEQGLEDLLDVYRRILMLLAPPIQIMTSLVSSLAKNSNDPDDERTITLLAMIYKVFVRLYRRNRRLGVQFGLPLGRST